MVRCIVLLGILFWLGPQRAGAQTYLGNFYDIEAFLNDGDRSYFVANTPEYGTELWVTDGTAKGTLMVRDLYPGGASSEPRNLFLYKGYLYFSARDPEGGFELFRSDGTPEGTGLFKEINTGQGSSSHPANFIIYEDTLYFTASDQYLNGNAKLFKSDGTPEGTVRADEVFDAERTSDVTNLTVANGFLYFNHVGLLYQTDGTAAGTTELVIDGLEKMTLYRTPASGLYFITQTYNNSIIRLYRLTAASEYEMLREFTSSENGASLRNLTALDGRVLFSYYSGGSYNTSTETLWITDGTAASTQNLKVFEGGTNYSIVQLDRFTVLGSKVYFAAPGSGTGLWESDGSAEGTTEVLSIAPRTDAPILAQKGQLYFLGPNIQPYSWTPGEPDPVNLAALSGFRRTTGDKYLLAGDQSRVYFTAANETRLENNIVADLYQSDPNSRMEVRAAWFLSNGDSYAFESVPDVWQVQEISVQNLGRAPLVFSEVQVSGEGFYINGNVAISYYAQEAQESFPQVLGNFERGGFEIGFLPSAPGAYEGFLTLKSNDTSQEEFRIKLTGYAGARSESSGAQDVIFPLEKAISWEGAAGDIQLSPSEISEEAVVGSVIGSLSTSIEGESFQFELFDSETYGDNQNFRIVSGQLQTAEGFGRQLKNSYLVRVQATGSSGTVLEATVPISVLAESEVPALAACSPTQFLLNADLYDLTFLDDNTAFIVGRYGTILRSKDKGATWERTHYIEQSTMLSGLFPVYSDLTGVDFVSATTGYIQGRETLLRTTDAGDNWQPVTLPESKYFGTKVAVTPISETDLYARTNYEAWKSTDGGANWFKLPAEGYDRASDEAFIDGALGCRSGGIGVIERTTDGGANWTPVALTSEGVPLEETVVDFFLQDGNTGYALTQTGSVLRTSDGGLQWNAISLGGRPSSREIYFATANRGYIFADTVYKTTDGGVTWVLADLTQIVFNEEKTIVNSLGDRIEIYDSGGLIQRQIRYAPAGSDWITVSGYSTLYNTFEILNQDETIYVFGREELRKSTDGGTTWSPLSFPENNHIVRVAFLQEEVLVGTTTGLYISSDGGNSWSLLKSSIYAVEFCVTPGGTIYAMNGRELERSTDKGITWESINPEVPQGRRTPYFISETTGFFGGFPGLYKTTDGGATWAELEIISGAEAPSVFEVAFNSETRGVISTTEGYYLTEDGGSSWSKLGLPNVQALTIQSFDTDQWYVASTYKIWQSSDNGRSWTEITTLSANASAVALGADVTYYTESYGEVYKLITDEPTLAAGPITGDQSVTVGAREYYTLAPHSDTRYAWSVDGVNTVTYEGNSAFVDWETPGTYTLQVVPYSSCQTGVPSEITVQVYEKPVPPIIEGPLSVRERSSGVLYSTPEDPNATYLWAVEGADATSAAGNTVSVDWGAMGTGQIGLIRTDLNSGLRSQSVIEVTILPTDPFEILVTDASCRGVANGSIRIVSKLPGRSYTLNLETNGSTSSYSFADAFLLENLMPGRYGVCLTADGTSETFCYELTLGQPDAFEVSSKIGRPGSKEVRLRFKGGAAPYEIRINDKMVALTSQEEYVVTAENGDILEVRATGACSLSYQEVLHLPSPLMVSPNPVDTHFTAYLDLPDTTDLEVTFFNTAGNRVLRTTAQISNGKAEVFCGSLPAGVYVVGFGSNAEHTIKILKR